MLMSRIGASRLARAFLFALLSVLVVPGATAQAPYATRPAVEAPVAYRGQSNVSLGDHYFHNGERIELFRRSNEVAIRLRPQFDSPEALAALTASSGPLAGFSVTREFGDGLRVLASESLRTTASDVAYSALTRNIARLGAEPNVLQAMPVFVNAKLGTYAIATDEVLVRLRPGVKADEFFADPRFRGYARAPASDAFLVRAAGGAGEPALALAASLQGDASILWAEPNFYQERQRFSVPNDALFAQQWHLRNTGQGGGVPGADANLVPAWAVATTAGQDIVIAIIDDGPELNHPDLRLFTNAQEVAGNGVDDDGNGFIDDVNGWDFTSPDGGDNNGGPSSAADEHGTSVAGVAAARGNNGIGVTGAAYNASFFPARIFNGPNPTNDANIAAALAYASGRGRTPEDQNWRGADIVNNSWGGGPPSAAINDALTWAAEHGRGGLGTIHFFATGNSGASSISLPAALSGTIASVIAVGASNNFDLRSSYSQFGPQLDFVAPSSGGSLRITTTDRLGAPGYNGLPDLDYTNDFGGTSSATPLASGIAALLLTRDPTLTVQQVRTLMRATADKIGPLAYNDDGFNVQYGYGRLNAANLVRAIDGARVAVALGPVAVESGEVLERTLLAGQQQVLTFTVRSMGVLDLQLGAVELEGDSRFSLREGLGASELALGESTSFEIEFASDNAGIFEALVTFPTNDPDVPVFTLPITFEVRPVPIAGVAFEDWNGDGLRQDGDLPVAGLELFVDLNNDGLYDGPLPTAFDSPANLALGFGNSPSIVSHTLQVAGLGPEVEGLEVRVHIQHAWVGDVRVRLIAPDGRAIVLVSQPGGGLNNGQNMVDTVFADDATATFAPSGAPYTGRYLPAEPLSTFDGIDPNGDWTLEVSDLFPPDDDGTLVNWTLTVFSDGEPLRVTDETGRFTILHLGPATYTVRALPLAGWTMLSPASGSRTVTVVDGESNFDVDFALVRQNAIYGRVYADVDADGSFDPGVDFGIEGETTFVDADANGIFDPPVSVELTSTPALPIPDLNAVGVSDTVESTLPGHVFSATVEVNINHTFVADLEVRLRSPEGTTVPLILRRGGNGNNFTGTVLDDAAEQPISAVSPDLAPFTGAFRPEQPLSTLVGELAAGTWELNVADRAALDTGSLVSWTLTLAASERFRTTNEEGNFRFDGAAGDVDLKLVVPPGFELSEPASGGYQFLLEEGDTVLNRDFGIYVNRTPVFTSIPLLYALEDAEYTYEIVASDPDVRDVLTLTATTLPSWLTFTAGAPGAGTLSGTPTAAEAGTHQVTLEVSDGVAPPVQQSFVVTVRGSGIFGNGFEAAPAP